MSFVFDSFKRAYYTFHEIDFISCHHLTDSHQVLFVLVAFYEYVLRVIYKLPPLHLKTDFLNKFLPKKLPKTKRVVVDVPRAQNGLTICFDWWVCFQIEQKIMKASLLFNVFTMLMASFGLFVCKGIISYDSVFQAKAVLSTQASPTSTRMKWSCNKSPLIPRRIRYNTQSHPVSSIIALHDMIDLLSRPRLHCTSASSFVCQCLLSLFCDECGLKKSHNFLPLPCSDLILRMSKQENHIFYLEAFARRRRFGSNRSF